MLTLIFTRRLDVEESQVPADQVLALYALVNKYALVRLGRACLCMHFVMSLAGFASVLGHVGGFPGTELDH